MRAAYFALVLGMVGGLLTATAVLTESLPPTSVAEALGLDGPDSADLVARREAAVASHTAACMAARGLTWSAPPASVPPIPDAELDPVAWADRWGFGLSTLADRPAAGDGVDVAAVRLGRLPTAERDRYRAALYGTPSRSGCVDTANAAVHGLRARLLRPLQTPLAALQADIAADPRSGLALATWQRCVTGLAGSDAADRLGLVRTLVTDFAARTSAAQRSAVALDGVRADERRVAGTLARCEAAYGADRERIARPHEAAFVAAHRSELLAIRATIQAAEAALPSVESLSSGAPGPVQARPGP
ncbi:MAG TPA: hypothetical protein VFI69_10765 [Candidatus Limnocylindrales bacterium]|nr:hypothetical protein [Candidatus Limnocylindrales bacterium]